MDPGTKVKVKSTASGSDLYYAGRQGIVVVFDPSLPWKDPRALLAPEQFVCVHFVPCNKREQTQGSPMALLDAQNLVVIATPVKTIDGKTLQQLKDDLLPPCGS